MKMFDYKEERTDLFKPEIINLVSKIHEHRGKQDLYIQTKPDILKSLGSIAKIQSTDASNRIEGIFTSDGRLRAIVEKKTEPNSRNEQEIAGYRDVLNLIHENHDLHSFPTRRLPIHRKSVV